MRDYTKEAILDKHRRALGRIDEVKERLGKYVSVNEETLVAYFIGNLRAIAFDIVGALENRGLEWNEFEGLLREAIDTIRKRVREVN